MTHRQLVGATLAPQRARSIAKGALLAFCWPETTRKQIGGGRGAACFIKLEACRRRRQCQSNAVQCSAVQCSAPSGARGAQ